MLDRYNVEFACPGCGFYNMAFLRQVRLHDVVMCRGCKASIQLEDYMGELRKAEQRLRRAIEDVETAFKNL